jgi:hypothetical protein
MLSLSVYSFHLLQVQQYLPAEDMRTDFLTRQTEFISIMLAACSEGCVSASMARGVVVQTTTNHTVTTHGDSFEHWPLDKYKAKFGDHTKNSLGHAQLLHEGC